MLSIEQSIVHRAEAHWSNEDYCFDGDVPLYCLKELQRSSPAACQCPPPGAIFSRLVTISAVMASR